MDEEHPMSEPQQPGPARDETAAFPTAPVPPPAPVGAVPAAPPTRRSRALVGAAAAGLLAVGVVVGLVVGQATAGTASAGDVSPTVEQTVPGDGSGYGSAPDGGVLPPGARGGTGRPGRVPGQGSTDGGGTDGGGAGTGGTGSGTPDDGTAGGTALDS